VLVEGKDDKKFFETHAQRLGINDTEVWYVDGVPNLATFLKALRGANGFAAVRSLGVVRDADTSPAAALAHVQSALTAAGLAVPASAMHKEPGQPDVTIMVLPDSATPGELEDLLLASVAGDPLMACVDAYFRCVDSINRGHRAVRSKAKVYAFIAASDNPRLRAGDALGRVFPRASAAFAIVDQFLTLL
jgi:hypothetical protein